MACGWTITTTTVHPPLGIALRRGRERSSKNPSRTSRQHASSPDCVAPYLDPETGGPNPNPNPNLNPNPNPNPTPDSFAPYSDPETGGPAEANTRTPSGMICVSCWCCPAYTHHALHQYHAPERALARHPRPFTYASHRHQMGFGLNFYATIRKNALGAPKGLGRTGAWLEGHDHLIPCEHRFFVLIVIGVTVRVRARALVSIMIVSSRPVEGT